MQHHAVNELLRNAGFSKRGGSRSTKSLLGEHAADPTSYDSRSTQSFHDLGATPQNTNESASTKTDTSLVDSGAESNVSNELTSSMGGVASSLMGGGNLVEGLLGGGLLGDLISGITSLFGGGSSQPPPLVQYSAPSSQNFELATDGSQLGDAVYNQRGDPQVAPITEPALSGLQYLQNAAATSSDSIGTAANPQSNVSPQITLNVQAMDSQSFLDRSQDIAQAVRQAMLNMHSINDVINDL